MTAPRNPRQPVRLGPVGQRVARRLHEIRKPLSLRDLEARLKELGHPISNDGLSKIETGKRRVDVDDLVALSVALDVSPVAFLLPGAGRRDDKVDLTPGFAVPARTAWRWMQIRAESLSAPEGDDGTALIEFYRRTLPAWVHRVPTSTPAGQRLLEEQELDED